MQSGSLCLPTAKLRFLLICILASQIVHAERVPSKMVFRTGRESNRVAGECVDISTPMKAKLLTFAAVVGLGTLVQANADDVQFVTLPQVVRTTVVRESNIPDYSRVTRVLRDDNGIFEVTVRRDTDNEVLYVDQAGRLVRQQTVAVAAPVQTTQPTQPILTQTVTETATSPGVDTFVRSLDDARYQLIEKKGNKEVYRDKNTGTKWVVKVERDDD
jgi:lipoprotein-anchoring transpeptidase ErfK/SrfK